MPQRWKHIRTGKTYYQLFECKVKLADGEWTAAMCYSSEETNEYFVRDLIMFHKNFIPA